ncbi:MULTISPECIES: VirB6/TrbL-like conjugal transfer protein, CD1112 family [unclassified Butyrivibrio]|uniref:VirB6/TrbL-like conjugal transfer protein, CD1112 family n=1 Tax=unclassified Butyrivibrio TaxID=2639466 RepID=UPI000479C703|nr:MULTISPECIES: CD0415/CD1112 family protein [unclassified Butyrivibrio]
MESVLEQIEEWFRNMLIEGIMEHLTNTFSSLNTEVGEISNVVGQTPAEFLPSVYNLIRTLSENLIMPIAGIILTIIACYELIQLVISHNNLANFETFIFFKWVFKTFVAVTLITNTFTITMAVFDVAKWVIERSGGIIAASTAVDASTLASMQPVLEAMDTGELFSIFLQTFVLQFLIKLAAVFIFIVVNGRMIEIYLYVSMAPIPFATFGNQEQSQMGQNYFKALWALGLQGFLIMVCVGIYAVMIQSVAFSSDIMASMWKVFGFTVLLGFTLLKSGSIAKSILHAT